MEWRQRKHTQARSDALVKLNAIYIHRQTHTYFCRAHSLVVQVFLHHSFVYSNSFDLFVYFISITHALMHFEHNKPIYKSKQWHKCYNA